MVRQVGQVGFQKTDNVRTVAGSEMLPVFGLQAVGRGEFLFGVKNQTGNPPAAWISITRMWNFGAALWNGLWSTKAL